MIRPDLAGLATTAVLAALQAALAADPPTSGLPNGGAPAQHEIATSGAAAPENGEEVQQIEVTGERAGPRLWRIARDDHVVWLLGTLEPLPRRMTWRSREVENVLSQAQEVLASVPSVSAGVGPIAAIRLYMQWRRTEKIPERGNLRALLPPPLYTRFAALKQRYDRHDQRIEELRPMVAARRLYERALDDSGLTSSNDIEDAVLKLARRHRVPIVRTSIKLQDPRGLLSEVGEIPRAAEIDCLEATIERLETDVPAMQARARDWALGDVQGLRDLPFPKQRQTCLNAVASAPRLKQLIDQATADWDAAVEAALRTHQTTLAMRSMYDLLGAEGVLARMRAKGYSVEGP